MNRPGFFCQMLHACAHGGCVLFTCCCVYAFCDVSVLRVMYILIYYPALLNRFWQLYIVVSDILLYSSTDDLSKSCHITHLMPFNL